MTPTDPIAAHRAVEAAAAKLADAETAHREARDRLDAALAAQGWRRAGGAFAPGTALYSRIGGNLVTLREVLDDIERQERTAAA